MYRVPTNPTALADLLEDTATDVFQVTRSGWQESATKGYGLLTRETRRMVQLLWGVNPMARAGDRVSVAYEMLWHACQTYLTALSPVYDKKHGQGRAITDASDRWHNLARWLELRDQRAAA